MKIKNLKLKIKPRYFPNEIEPYWQNVWKEKGLYKFKNGQKPHSAKASRGKYYNLVELPYPSGDLHFGHWFSFVPADAHARFKRMSGFNVFFPNGFDAFGLPAENAAIKRGIHPKDWTMKNIEAMTKQFATMGTMIDWDYTAITCLPEYYRWNQWIFLKMFEKGLAYRGKALSNWCPIDKTVLANEHIEQGKCWRCGTEVIQKEVEQWFLAITKYADKLIWPENTEAVGCQSRFSNDTRSSFPKNQSQTRSLSESLFSSLNNKPNKNATAFDSSQSELAPSGQKHKSYVDWPARHARQASSEVVAGWPKEVREAQNNWIGRSEGMLLQFPISDANSRQSRFSDDVRRTSSQSSKLSRSLSESLSSNSKDNQNEDVTAFGSPQSELPPVSMENGKWKMVNGRSYIEVFTTRPETTDGATFLVVAPEHEFVTSLLKIKDKISSVRQAQDKNLKYKEILEYVEEAKKKTEMERKEDRTKSGIFTGKYVKNPVTGRDIPVWISDYVLAGYGTGAIMAVPFADERDREFAEKFDLPITETKLNAAPKGEKKINYHLRDWSVSRQRYWGTPVPIIYCKTCAKKGGGQPHAARDARQTFSQSSKTPRSLSESRLSTSNDNQNKHEPSFGSLADGLSSSGPTYKITVIDGEEYAMIPVPYEDLPVELPYNVDYTPKGKPPLASDEKWLNVKCPKCKGKAKRDAETLDTFFDSAWYYYRYVSPQYDKEPFDRLRAKQLLPVDVYVGGAEHTVGHTLYARFFTKFFKDLGLVDFDEFALKRVQHGVILGPDGNRMSKSKGNVVNPDEVVKEYGADAVRLYLCFMMPYEATAPWSTTAISGIYRFLKRVWELQYKIKNQKSKIKNELNREDLTQMHITIKKVGEDLENFHFNTAVAVLMTWLNFLSAKKEIGEEEYETFLKLLSPFAPHITEEIWQSISLIDKGQSEDRVFSRQSRFSDDARSSFSNNQSQTHSLSESLSSDSKDNQSEEATAFDSPQSELPPSDTSKSSRANNSITANAGSRCGRTIQQLNNFKSIHLESWPKFDPEYLVADEVSVVVQINGKVRGTIRVKSLKLEVQSYVEEEARKSEKVKKYLDGNLIRKVIYVEGKIINFVTSN